MRYPCIITPVVIFLGVIKSSMAQQWKPITEKKADIGIVVDKHPLEMENQAPDDAWLWNLTTTLRDRRMLNRLIEEGVTPLLTRKDEADVRFAVMYHESETIHLPVTLQQSVGQTAQAFSSSVQNSFESFSGLQRLRGRLAREGTIVSEARKAMAGSPGNRPDMPDLLVWIALYRQIGNFKYEPLATLRDRQSGPDVVIAVENYDDIHQMNIRFVDTQGTAKELELGLPYRKEFTDSIIKMLQSCTSETQDSACFFNDTNGACLYETTIQPAQTGNDPKNAKYCEAPTVTLHECNSSSDCTINCRNAPQEPGPCSATCGVGSRQTRPREAAGNKYLQHCPPVTELCPIPPVAGPGETKPPHPTVSTTTTATTYDRTSPAEETSTSTSTTEKPFLEQWMIAVIASGATALLLIIIGIIICCACQRKKKSRRVRKHLHPPYSKSGPTSYLAGGALSRRGTPERRNADRLTELLRCLWIRVSRRPLLDTSLQQFRPPPDQLLAVGE